MFSGNSALFAAVLSSLSLAQAAANDPPAPAGAAIPQCAAKCMSIKISEAAGWFGASKVADYCKHPEFLLAYNNCLQDNCQGEDLVVGKQAGVTACAGVTPDTPAGVPGAANSTAPGNINNTTAHLSGPANAPVPDPTSAKSGSNPAQPVNLPNNQPNSSGPLNGALPPTTSSPPNAAANNTTGRFSGAVGSAAANASSQAGDANSIASASALLFTTFSSCALSLLL